MKFILGKKQNMIQYFGEDGKVYPGTVIAAGPVTVTQVKTKDVDGYEAVQVGYGTRKDKRVNKAQKKMGSFAHVKEFRTKTGTLPDLKVGDSVGLDTFTIGDTIVVTATSKAKGFQGVVKRHGFHGGPRTHGQKHSEREPGSIGGGLRNRVPKGMRMGGRMGGDTITVKNLKVVDVDMEEGVIVIKGAVPGRRGTLVSIIG